MLVVSAPAGFGKTTMLAEALAESGAVGIDCWLACEPDDATESSLAIGLCEAVAPDRRRSIRSREAASAVTRGDVATLTPTNRADRRRRAARATRVVGR